MRLHSQNILVEIDSTTGATKGIYQPEDAHEMNWVLENSVWGIPEGFETKRIDKTDNGVIVTTEHPDKMLQLVIRKELSNDGYYETYELLNLSEMEFFVTKDNLGIPFPYQCQLESGKHALDECCTTHVWCGGNVCWMQSVRNRGEVPYLFMQLTEGSIEDYSISYDISRVRNAAFFRGVIVLHPSSTILLPGQTIIYRFRHRFVNDAPDNVPLDFKNAMRFTAQKYSWFQGEKVDLILECAEPWENAVIQCDGEEITYKKVGNTALCCYSFDQLGEKRITAEVAGKKTWINVQVILPVSEILERRARFITEKQQYHCPGSHLDGAYLIYDNQEKRIHYSANMWEQDHNAGRERIGMGAVVCRQLQRKYDEKMMQSLRKHREFVERELIDVESGMVFNDAGKSDRLRIFNFPWVSTYYLEWYRLNGEKKCIEIAAKILLKYYEFGGKNQDSQCIEAAEILQCLENEKLIDLHNKLKEEFLKHAEAILQRDGAIAYAETSWSNEPPNDMCCYLSQAYLITGEEKYRKKAAIYVPMSNARFSTQPDYHMNCISLRYWDRYWFGKVRTYGDTFPHYWTTLVAWTYAWYDRAYESKKMNEIIQNCLLGNLCIYREDGFAANTYLYPYKVVQYSSDPTYENRRMQPCVAYGKHYDAWANDQDWSLYYASRFVNENGDETE